MCLPDVLIEIFFSVQYMMSVKHCCKTSKLYILFVDKEHTFWGIGVKTTWKFIVKQKLQFYSQYNNCFKIHKKQREISPWYIQSSKVIYCRENIRIFHTAKLWITSVSEEFSFRPTQITCDVLISLISCHDHKIFIYWNDAKNDFCRCLKRDFLLSIFLYRNKDFIEINM